MPMHNPPHPGDFIRRTFMEPFSLSARCLAKKLDVAPSTLNRLLRRQSRVSAEMAMRLHKALGAPGPACWLAMQDAYDLWQARGTALDKVQKVDFDLPDAA